jgi:uncharacterized glyoxalase superfamily protein PhnB
VRGVSAELAVRRGRAAVEFYEAAFGAAEIYRVGGTDDHEAVVAQLAVGETTFWAQEESHQWLLGGSGTRSATCGELGKPLVAWPPAGTGLC